MSGKAPAGPAFQEPVIHKVGGYGSGSDISRWLYALADTWDAIALTNWPYRRSNSGETEK
jgi:hypothetical protein